MERSHIDTQTNNNNNRTKNKIQHTHKSGSIGFELHRSGEWREKEKNEKINVANENE